jgi:hypothetical protein
MSGFAVYTPTQVRIIVGVIPIVSLYGADEFVRIEKAEDDVIYEASADGGATLSVVRGSEHTVTITLQHTSPDNLKLSAMYKAGRLLAQGALIFPITIIDSGSNGNLFVSDKAWFKRVPDEAYAKQAQAVEWQLGVHSPERFIGGH